MESRLNEMKSKIYDNDPLQDPPVHLEALVDALTALVEDMSLVKSDHGPKFVSKYEPVMKNFQENRINLNDYEFIKILAQGAFGTVSLIRSKVDRKLYALKTLNKQVVLRQENVFFFEERNVMARGRDSDWIPDLIASFQDTNNLYLVMEYIPGGDLINLLENGEFEGMNVEDVARFYGAQMLLAIDELHQMNFIHRDLKPHNILIQKDGHIKLADFGAAIQLDQDGQCRSTISVGTPDYICPEILKSTDGATVYGKECDWWSFGTILYEIVCGDPPFYAEHLSTTYGRIMSSPTSLEWPEDVEISGELKDLLFRLLLPADKRLGRNGVEEIKKHPFFRRVDFDNIKKMTPPFVPSLENEEDTSNFPDFEDDILGQEYQKNRIPIGLQLPFIGFYYHKDYNLTDAIHYPSTDGKALVAPNTKELERKNAEIDELKALNGQVKDQIEQLKSQVGDAQANSTKLEALSADKAKVDASLKDARQELKDMMGFLDKNHSKISELEKTVKQLKTEREEVEAKVREANRGYENSKKQLEAMEEILASKDAELDEQRQQLRELEGKGGTVTEVDKIHYQLQEEIDAKSKLSEELQVLQSKFFEANKCTAELEHRVMVAEQSCDVKSKDIQSLKEQLDKSATTHDALQASKYDLEKQLTLNQHEIKDLQSKLEESRSKNRDLEDQLLHSIKGDASSDQLDNLALKLKASEEEQETLIRLLSKSEMAKNALQADINVLGEKLKKEQRLRYEVEIQLDEKDALINEQKQEKANFDNEMSMKEFLYNEVKERLDKVSKDKDELTQFVDMMKQEKNIMQKEIHSLRHNTGNETKIRHEFEDRLRQKDRELLQFKTKMTELETAHEEAENNMEDLQRVLKSKDEFVRFQDEEINKLTADFDALKEEMRILKVEYDQSERRIVELIHARDAEKRRADAVYSEQEGLFLRLSALEKELKQTKEKQASKRERGEIRELMQQLDNANMRIKELESKNHQEMSPRQDNDDGDVSQLLSVAEEPRVRDRRKSSYEVGIRGKKKRMTVSASITIDAKGELFLRGWIQVPKSERITKGLKKKYLLLRDLQVWGYEREKDVNDEGKGHVIADLKSELLVVNHLNITDLGGLSQKDIDCGFKVQFMRLTSFAGHRKQSSVAPPNSNGHRLLELRRKLAAEQRLLLAAQKYLHHASEGARTAVSSEQEKCRELINQINGEIRTILERDPDAEIEEKSLQHQDYINRVEKAVEREEQFIQGVKKMTTANFWKKSSDDLNKELQNSLKRLAHLRLELDKWKRQNDNVMTSIQELDTEHIPENGHYFKSGYLKQEIVCDLCLDMITGSPVEITQCDTCKLIAHPECRNLITMTCHDVKNLQNASTLYFFASNAEEKWMWMRGIEYYRRLYEEYAIQHRRL